jgi:natural resistance-associated macrophage protein 2
MHYSLKHSRLLWVIGEISLVGCDVQAVICTAIALKIIFRVDYWVGCLATFLDIFIYYVAEKFPSFLDHLFVVLLSLMALCFFWNFSVNPPHASGKGREAEILLFFIIVV